MVTGLQIYLTSAKEVMFLSALVCLLKSERRLLQLLTYSVLKKLSIDFDEIFQDISGIIQRTID